jgi:2-(1,2-epoxy-1,2-dihydrophenyl)acetyl-CoA isomerase
MNDTVLLTRDGAVATLTLNRPNAFNALDFAMADALVECASAVASDDALRVVVLRGAGRHFMVGGDIRTFGTQLAHPPAKRQADHQMLIEKIHAAIEQLQRMPHPLIGCLHGAVAGIGLSLACACDMVYAAEGTYFASAYRHIAQTPDGGGSWTLPRLVGTHKAMEILLLGERFDAAEALRLGIVNKLVAADALDAAVEAAVQSLVAAPVLAIRNTRRLVRESLSRTLSEQLQAEAISFGQCAGSDDFVEGVTAFLDKRAARFGGA